jgi:hypothetical protein
MCRTRLFDEYCLLPRTLALNKYFLTRGFLLSGVSTTQIIPGEEPEEMHHGRWNPEKEKYLNCSFLTLGFSDS